MNSQHRMYLIAGLICAFAGPAVRGQEAVSGEETEQRVQYQLVLPEEKTPENVKPEEHNPFESESEAQNRLAPGDTEENRVRDKLLKLPVVGTKRMADGRMRVLLGNIILETGGDVPPVLPEQMVELKVKNITSEYIELAWQEKRATGLPPKLMIIPINIAPKVRYQMLGQTEDDPSSSNGVNATMDFPRRNFMDRPEDTPPATVSTPPATPKAEFVADDPASPFAPRSVEKEMVATSQPPQAAAQKKPAEIPAQATAQTQPPSSPAVESVVRMLFGNPTPAPK
ncbi:hypothetical protein [Prosthecobacter sp.]|uniref:hypothetical protein n=1 Tax=Prosthecobacter sp. TaxID=1965333 RepID=UPI001D930008|nr:hypothetical protein [Prosthecobacter sp.]MCB1277357.1 hypothetical protein [Prosthecobacter sp.]